eukprot:CAMPEP_0114693908 /NCGR_PEP_ID=MMETSP0191-20121206/69589_1 /TAXON_ID=126664 /ORGANISM="Sorites sp." /LENGTH=43 /DNA_ID= /DNA_START= /DNA_END= /DNA_ORIENTATION=
MASVPCIACRSIYTVDSLRFPCFQACSTRQTEVPHEVIQGVSS